MVETCECHKTEIEECLFCNKEFETNKDELFCSEKCSKEWQEIYNG